jgi:PKD repeat protein
MKTAIPVCFVTLLAVALVSSSAASADVVIPSSAFSAGANSAEFHSDVRIFNPSTTSPVLVTPVFYQSDANGGVTNTVTSTAFVVPPRSQVRYDNVLSSLFGLAKGVFGPIRFQANAPLIVSSGVNNVNACGTGAVSGQWLPGIDPTQALSAGTLVQLGVSVDAATGYRTNVDLMNPGTSTANVTIRVRKGDGSQLSSNTLAVPANGLLQRRLDDASTFPGVAGATDTNLWLEFTSDQPVLAFASVINNASGDPFAIVMTAEPNVSAPVPVASYTVSPASPGAGQAATFTDTSTNLPTTQLWVFGDGATATSGATVQHTYAAAGTYKTTHFAGNAAGTSAASKDVAVAAAAPITVTISATTTGQNCWTFTCLEGPCSAPMSYCNSASKNNVNLKVGQPYVITWTTPASENKIHGIGGDAANLLGITQCDPITASQPCTVTFTPTANLLNVQGGVYTYSCTHTECAPNQTVHNKMTGTITIVP